MEKIKIREIIIGLICAIVSGVVVWELTKNVELSSQLEAIKTIGPVAEKASNDAAIAQTEARIALDTAQKAIENVKKAEIEAENIVANLKAVDVYKKVESSMDDLRKIATETAERETRYQFKNKSFTVEFGSVKSYKLNETIQAETAGIVVADVDRTDQGILVGSVGTHSGNLTRRVACSIQAKGQVYLPHASIVMPVSKGEWWKVHPGSGTVSHATIYWFPLIIKVN